MASNERIKSGLTLIIFSVEAVVGLSILWKKVGPQVKSLLKPLYECTKKVLNIDNNGQSRLTITE